MDANVDHGAELRYAEHAIVHAEHAIPKKLRSPEDEKSRDQRMVPAELVVARIISRFQCGKVSEASRCADLKHEGHVFETLKPLPL
jgi:hypothetical protein